MDIESLLLILVCPQCHKGKLLPVAQQSSELYCEECLVHYPIVHGRPVLLRDDNELFQMNHYRHLESPVTYESKKFWQRIIPSPSLNLANHRVLSNVRQMLAIKPSVTVLVVGGGCQRKWLNELLGSDSLEVLYSDIDSRADVDLFCDGHDLPFMDEVFDAVITTAVLEHVLYPERVAAEIIRVLKVGGLLYSELPFMQQVHEGAYDFTRYTMSGHQRLFNRVSVIERGLVAGPGTALVWAIENFFIAFTARPFGRKASKLLTRLLFGWIKYFDLFLINRPAAMDGASCTFLLGSKIKGSIPDADIIAQYIGAQNLRHI